MEAANASSVRNMRKDFLTLMSAIGK